MGIRQVSESLNRLAGPLIKATAGIAGVSLFSMMLLVAIDVILRSFKRPVPGTYEVVEYLMALTVSFGIVACAHRGEHIKVDIVTNALAGSVKTTLASLVALITVIYTLPIMWENLLYIQDLYSSRVTS
ncbi:MAG: TRAP transporter small permease, partial [Pseudomonadota bacterium]